MLVDSKAFKNFIPARCEEIVSEIPEYNEQAKKLFNIVSEFKKALNDEQKNELDRVVYEASILESIARTSVYKHTRIDKKGKSLIIELD